MVKDYIHGAPGTDNAMIAHDRKTALAANPPFRELSVYMNFLGHSGQRVASYGTNDSASTSTRRAEGSGVSNF